MILRFGALAVLMILSAVASAQDHQPAARTEAEAATSAELVKTGLFIVSGAGGNTAVRLSGSGIILIDGKRPGHYRELIAKVGRIADELPISLVVNTSQDETHTGTNTDFLLRGIPVLAQANVREALKAGGSTSAPIAPPSEVFEQERTIRLGGVTVQLLHFGPARTSGDAIAYFSDLKVVAVGDLFSREAPEVHLGAGGSLAGWSAALEKILQLDFDRVIPGSGPVTDRAELQRFKSKLDATVAAR